MGMGDAARETSEIHVSDIVEIYGRDQRRAHENWIGSCEYSQDGSQLLTSSYDRTGKIWATNDFKKRPVLRKIPDGAWTSGATFLQGESHYVIWRTEKEAFVCSCDPNSDELVNVKPQITLIGQLFKCRRYPGKENMIGISAETETLLYDISTQTSVRAFKGGRANVFSEYGDTLYYSEGTSIIRCDLRAPEYESATLTTTLSAAKDLTIQRDNNMLYYACGNDVLGYNLDVERAEFKVAHNKEVMCLDVQKSGANFIISSSRDGTAILWDSFTGDKIAVLFGNERDSAFSAAISPLNNQIVVGSMYNLHIFGAQLPGCQVQVKSARK